MAKRRRRRFNPDKWRAWQYVGVGALAVATAVMVGIAFTPEQVPASTEPRPTRTVEPTPEPVALTVPGAGASVLVMGDSWSAGASADPGLGYVDRLIARTGWNVTLDAVPGTGYQSTMAASAQTYQQRASALPDIAPELVIIQGGLNDFKSNLDALPASVTATVEAVEAKYPSAQIVLLGPGTFQLPVPETVGRVDSILGDVARRTGVFYISPQDSGWMTPENFSTFWDPDTQHPTTAGHELWEARLWDALTTATRPG